MAEVLQRHAERCSENTYIYPFAAELVESGSDMERGELSSFTEIGGETKTVTANTRPTAVFIERGVGGLRPERSLHPENGFRDPPRCLHGPDSVHVGEQYTYQVGA